MFSRIILYILTNMAILFVFGIVMTILGISPESIWGTLIFAGFFGFIGSFMSLLMSKSMAKRTVRPMMIEQPSTEEEIWLINNIKAQADTLGIGMPEVGIYRSDDLNAFATGANRNSSLVCISSGLLRAMNRDEVMGVIGHELNHVANGDMVTMSLLQGILNTFVIYFAQIISRMIATDKDGRTSYGMYQIVYIGLQMVFGCLASLIILAFTRYREYRADFGSAKLVGKNKMISALRCLQRHYEPTEQVEGELVKFGINGKISSLFSSHPPLEKRIERIQRISEFD